MLSGLALFAPSPATPHVCANGPTWSGVTSPISDQWNGLCKVGDTWIATGAGQAGTTPSNSIVATAAGGPWTAGGTLPNLSNGNPFSLRAGAHNGWAICLPSGNLPNGWVTRDKGQHWVTFLTGGPNISVAAIESGNSTFVYLDSTAAFTYSSASGAGVVANATPAKLARLWWNPNRSLWLAFENGGTRSWTTTDLVTYTAGPTMPFDSVGIPVYGISQKGANIVIVYNTGTSQNGAYSLNDGVTFAASAAFPGGAEQSYSVAHGNNTVICTIAIGSSIMVSSDGGATYAAGNANTATKTWVVANDGLNTWLAVGGGGTPDTVLNVGAC